MIITLFHVQLAGHTYPQTFEHRVNNLIGAKTLAKSWY